jgi:hypothetical protein
MISSLRTKISTARLKSVKSNTKSLRIWIWKVPNNYKNRTTISISKSKLLKNNVKVILIEFDSFSCLYYIIYIIFITIAQTRFYLLKYSIDCLPQLLKDNHSSEHFYR